MLSGVVQQSDDVMVVERVEGQAADATDADEPGGAEQAKLMRYSRLGHLHQAGEVADATLAVAECVNKPHPRRVAEQFEDVRHRLDRRQIEKTSLDGGKRLSIMDMAAGARLSVCGDWPGDWRLGSHEL